MILEFGINRTIHYHALTMAEMVLFKVLYIYKYSRIAAMDEYFLTFIVTLFNIVIIFGFTVIRISLKEHLMTRWYYHTFGSGLHNVYTRVMFP